MTLPNKITISRIIGTPVFYLLFLFIQHIKDSYPFYAKVGVFFLALLWIFLEVSDLVDGHLARKYNLVSNMGKLLDPFSDVLSRITYFVCFVEAGFMPMWPLVIIFWRELSITFVRAVMASGGITLAANKGGKTKAIFYFATSVIGMFMLFAQVFDFLEKVAQPYYGYLFNFAHLVFALAAASAIISFAGYFKLFLQTDYVRNFINE